MHNVDVNDIYFLYSIYLAEVIRSMECHNEIIVFCTYFSFTVSQEVKSIFYEELEGKNIDFFVIGYN